MRLNTNHNSFLESQSQMDIFLLFKWDPVSNRISLCIMRKCCKILIFKTMFFLTGNKKERKWKG